MTQIFTRDSLQSVSSLLERYYSAEDEPSRPSDEAPQPTNEPEITETKSEKKNRTKSLVIVHFTLFLESFGCAIAMTGVWPYLDKLDPTAGKEFFSYLGAANALATFLCSPLLGFWMNHVSSIRIPIIVSLTVFCGSSALYSSLPFIDFGVKYWMLTARFLLGAASAHITICRNYIVSATKDDERTFAISMGALAQVSGFIAGPFLQAALTNLGEDGRFNMYTAPGWINLVLGVVNMIIFLPCIFKDHKVDKPFDGNEILTEVEGMSAQQHFLAWKMIFCYFIVSLNVVILESLSTPITMDQFAFSKEEALKWNGILIGIGALISCMMFCFLPRICKIFNEVDVLIIGGFVMLAIGKFLYVPFRSGTPQIAGYQTVSMANGRNLKEEIFGCPISQRWCKWTPRLGIPEYVIGFFFAVIGYPVGTTLIQTVVSKILGNRPQGTWTGFVVAAGAVSKIIGNLVIVRSYTEFGIVWTFAALTFVQLLPVISTLVVRKRILKISSNDDKYVSLADIKA